MIIIGLGGKAGSGKSTVAEFLGHFGFREMAFAEPLKEAAALLFGFNEEQVNGALKEIVDGRLGKSPRMVLQELGDACRAIWPEVFVSAIRRRLFRVSGRVVISDVRFLNEARCLELLGAKLIRVQRPGAGARSGLIGHASEEELDAWTGWSATIVNDGTRERLYRQVGYLLQGWGIRPVRQVEAGP